MNDTERALALADRFGEELSNATRRSPRRSATTATTTGSPTSARRAGLLSETRNRWRSSPRSTATRSTSPSARRWTCSAIATQTLAADRARTDRPLHGEPLRRTRRPAGRHRVDPAHGLRAPGPLRRAPARIPAFPGCARDAREGVATGWCPPRTSSAPSRRSSASWPRRRRTHRRSRRWPTTTRPRATASSALARRRRAAFRRYLDVLRDYLPHAVESKRRRTSPAATRSTPRRSGRGRRFRSTPGGP